MKDLCKNRHHINGAIESFERLLIKGQLPPGDRYRDLKLLRGDTNANIVKFRVFVPKTGGGNQSGVRYVCEFVEVDGEEWAILLSVHLHSQGRDNEQFHRSVYRGRCQAFDIGNIKTFEVTYAKSLFE